MHLKRWLIHQDGLLSCVVLLAHIALLATGIFLSSKPPSMEQDQIIQGQLLGVAVEKKGHPSSASILKKQSLARPDELIEGQLGSYDEGIFKESEAPLYGAANSRLASHQPHPSYPLSSKKLREEGLLMLKFCVNPAGTVDAAHIITSSGYSRLDESALEAIRRWRFPHALQTSLASSDCYRMPVQFSLRA